VAADDGAAHLREGRPPGGQSPWTCPATASVIWPAPHLWSGTTEITRCESHQISEPFELEADIHQQKEPVPSLGFQTQTLPLVYEMTKLKLKSTTKPIYIIKNACHYQNLL
jgi:hypothetical protein